MASLIQSSPASLLPPQAPVPPAAPQERKYPDIGLIEMGLRAIKDLVVKILSYVCRCFFRKAPPPPAPSPQPQPPLAAQQNPPPPQPLPFRPSGPPIDPLLMASPSPTPRPNHSRTSSTLSSAFPPSPAPPPPVLPAPPPIDPQRVRLQKILDGLGDADDTTLLAHFGEFYNTEAMRDNLHYRIGLPMLTLKDRFLGWTPQTLGKWTATTKPSVLRPILAERITQLLKL